MRVGIATGLVVSDLAAGGGWEEVAVGKPLHLADRLQAIAEPGTVVIAEGTRRLIGELFALENLGRHRLKGFSSPVQAWRVCGEGTAESRFEALRGASPASLVGRRQELRLLLDRWEQAKEGEGQLILLAGEAGIGKSRLVRALREELGQEPHAILRHHGSPQHSNTALHPIIGYLERASGLRRETVPDRQLARLEALLASAAENAREDAWLLADLLGVPFQGRQPTLEPPQKKERTFGCCSAMSPVLRAAGRCWRSTRTCTGPTRRRSNSWAAWSVCCSACLCWRSSPSVRSSCRPGGATATPRCSRWAGSVDDRRRR